MRHASSIFSLGRLHKDWIPQERFVLDENGKTTTTKKVVITVFRSQQYFSIAPYFL